MKVTQLPNFIISKWLIVSRLKKFVSCQLSVIGFTLQGLTIRPVSWGKYFKLTGVIAQPLKGFTIIEFLIVMSILAIAGTLVTTSYLSFEKRQRVKSAALEIKGQIRLAQSNALSGFKGKDSISGNCDTSLNYTLVGWYALIDKVGNELKIAGVCDDGTGEFIFAESTLNLDPSLEMIGLDYEGFASGPRDFLVILFRPLENDAVFYEYDAPTSNIEPPVDSDRFVDSSGILNPIGVVDGDPLEQRKVIIDIDLEVRGNPYNIEIYPSGEINEVQL